MRSCLLSIWTQGGYIVTKEEIIIEYGKLKVIRRGYDLELNDGKNIFIKPAYFKQGVAKNEKQKYF